MTSALHARVVIVSRDDAFSAPLAEGLDRLGWRTVSARGPHAAAACMGDLQIEGVIVDLSSGGDDSLSLARRLKAECGQRRVPVIAVGDPMVEAEANGFDLLLAPPLHPAQAAMRLEGLVRLAVSEEEFELRTETFAAQGRALEEPEVDPSPYRILAIGEPAPQFLALSNALACNGAEVVGAFTAFTAFDYLHERPFDAVVLWAGASPQEALSIASGLRRNTRLYHTPAVLYMSDNAYVTIAEAYGRGVSDVASPDTSEADTARRIVELARGYRRQTAVRNALEKARGSGLMDPATGLFSRELFALHLARLAEACRKRNRPLSVCVLRVADRAAVKEARLGGWLGRAIPQIGSMIGRLVRVEDTAARLGPDIFALALPATGAKAARAAGDRIAAVIGCTAFEAGDAKPPFVVEFDIGVAEVYSADTAGRALEDAAKAALLKSA